MLVESVKSVWACCLGMLQNRLQIAWVYTFMIMLWMENFLDLLLVVDYKSFLIDKNI